MYKTEKQSIDYTLLKKRNIKLLFTNKKYVA